MTSSRSVRFKISALLVIPLLSLGALWAFGASVTLRESANLLTVASLYADIGKPGDELAIALQREHVLSAEYLGTRSERALSRERALGSGVLIADRALSPGESRLFHELATTRRLNQGTGEKASPAQAVTGTQTPVDALTGTEARAATDQASPDARALSGRSPEQSRALLNSLQSGWRRGRADSERDGEEV
jgi:hypothetical protein